MKCRYCNVALAPLRSLTDGEFCCDDHRHAFSEEQAARTEVFLQPPLQDALLPLAVSFSGGIPGSTAAPICALDPREYKLAVVKPASSLLTPETEMFLPDPPALERMLPLQFAAAPADADTGCTEELPGDLEFPGVIALPQCDLEQISIPVEPELAPAPEMIPQPEPAARFEFKTVPEEEPVETVHPYSEVANSWHWLRDAWRNAPRDLKVVTVLLPVLLAVAVGPSVRKGKGHVASTPSLPAVHSLPSLPALPVLPSLPSGHVQQVMADRLSNLHQTILNRAAVDLTDDFRSGLDAWESQSNLTTSWSYDATGFVQPGPLAVFKPSKDLMDYRFQFLGEIDQKGLGAAFRAADLNNYYVVKLAVVKPGPLPVVRLVRYAVIDGKEERHVEKPLQLAARPDTLYRMVVDVRGSDFTIMAQGQLIDFWTDNRLPRGGVGFFCSRGEKARVRWVEVSHQYDALGRLCAYLAPYGFEGRNGNFN
jgi:hypothetical protein